MSLVLTRSPLEAIGMNRGATQKRRSARLSGEGNGEHEPPAKKAKVNSGTTTTINTKQQDGESKKTTGKNKRHEYTDQADDFQFARKVSKRKKVSKDTATESASLEVEEGQHVPVEPVADNPAPKTVQKKTRRRLPTTPEDELAKKPARRSKRISDDRSAETVVGSSPHQTVQSKPHQNEDRSPSPGRGRPVTVDKRRPLGGESRRETKVMQIALPFADTPIQRRNKEMRKTSAEGHRRSSTGMRGKRASSVIDEGRGNALPHAEVPASEFYKHIAAEITEPRRMRSLLGWCGTRELPSKPHPPLQSTPAAMLEFQARQAAHVIQEELSQSLMTNGMLSDWFSRDDSVPLQRLLRKKANPRNIANAAKADELERELERLKTERAEWDALAQSAALVSLQSDNDHQQDTEAGGLSPIHPSILDSPQREIFEQLNSASDNGRPTSPTTIHEKLRAISDDLEFAVDHFAHGIHALSTTRATAERMAQKSLAEAADALEEKEKQRAHGIKAVDQMDALRGLARVLNSEQRR